MSESSSSNISPDFNASAEKAPVDLKVDFEKSHHLPKVQKDFDKVAKEKIEPNLSEPSLALTREPPRSLPLPQRTTADQSVDQSKLPKVTRDRDLPRREQFNKKSIKKQRPKDHKKDRGPAKAKVKDRGDTGRER